MDDRDASVLSLSGLASLLVERVLPRRLLEERFFQVRFLRTTGLGMSPEEQEHVIQLYSKDGYATPS